MVGSFVNECLICNLAHLLTRIEPLKDWLREMEAEEVSDVHFTWDEEELRENEVTEQNRSIFNLGINEWRLVMEQFSLW